MFDLNPEIQHNISNTYPNLSDVRDAGTLTSHKNLQILDYKQYVPKERARKSKGWNFIEKNLHNRVGRNLNTHTEIEDGLVFHNLEVMT